MFRRANSQVQEPLRVPLPFTPLPQICRVLQPTCAVKLSEKEHPSIFPSCVLKCLAWGLWSRPWSTTSLLALHLGAGHLIFWNLIFLACQMRRIIAFFKVRYGDQVRYIYKELGTCRHIVGAQQAFTIKQRLGLITFLKVIRLTSYQQSFHRTSYPSSKSTQIILKRRDGSLFLDSLWTSHHS